MRDYGLSQSRQSKYGILTSYIYSDQNVRAKGTNVSKIESEPTVSSPEQSSKRVQQQRSADAGADQASKHNRNRKEALITDRSAKRQPSLPLLQHSSSTPRRQHAYSSSLNTYINIYPTTASKRTTCTTYKYPGSSTCFGQSEKDADGDLSDHSRGFVDNRRASSLHRGPALPDQGSEDPCPPRDKVSEEVASSPLNSSFDDTTLDHLTKTKGAEDAEDAAAGPSKTRPSSPQDHPATRQ